MVLSLSFTFPYKALWGFGVSQPEKNTSRFPLMATYTYTIYPPPRKDMLQMCMSSQINHRIIYVSTISLSTFLMKLHHLCWQLNHLVGHNKPPAAFAFFQGTALP